MVLAVPVPVIMVLTDLSAAPDSNSTFITARLLTFYHMRLSALHIPYRNLRDRNIEKSKNLVTHLCIIKC